MDDLTERLREARVQAKMKGEGKKPLTERQLGQIENRQARSQLMPYRMDFEAKLVCEDVPRLVAEVRRLKAEAGRL